MNLTRRGFLLSGVAAGSMMAASGPALPATDDGAPVTIGANGLFTQPWFEDGFLDLKDELEEAISEKKQLVILYEQAGCPYCKTLHSVNLQKAEIASFMQKHFRVVQLDIKGSREVTDFTGAVMSEKAFSQHWQIHFTPTLSFFPRDAARVIGQTDRKAEAFRLTGYWKPFHFETVLHFVHSGSYKNDNLQTYLAARLQKLKAMGKKVKVWE